MPISWWLAGSAQGDMIYAFQTSNLSGKVIVVLLFAASVLAWSVMVTKFRELGQSRRSSQRFMNAFRSTQQPLTLFLREQQYPDSPLYQVYESACATVGLELDARGMDRMGLYADEETSRGVHLSASQVQAVRNAAERAVADQALLLEDKMGFLATAVSASPMLGLLGTVWGVLDAFAGMGQQGMANLSSVAPGISGALLTTVIGLLVALPSVIGYNMLTSRIRRLCVMMDNFTDEFVAALQRSLGQD